jgi:formate dehydrogenase assembly factor FdhD
VILETFLAPKTKSTEEALFIISFPKWLAVQPQTPIFAPSFLYLLKTPISEKSLATGFSLTEQVLMMIMSASEIACGS